MIVMPAALDEAILSLHALHKEQRLFLCVESLVRLHRWLCQDAVETNLSVLGILRRIRSGGPGSALAVSTEENLGREDNTSSV